MECDKKTQSAIKPSTVEVAQIIKRWFEERKKEKLKKRTAAAAKIETEKGIRLWNWCAP